MALRKVLFIVALLSGASKSLRAEGADFSLEAVGGAITFHLIDDGASSLYVTKLNQNGRLIYNPIYGVNLIAETKDSFLSLGGFIGENSVGLPIQGGLFAGGVKFLSGHVYLGATAGGYVQNDKAFRAKGVVPFKLFEFAHYEDFVPLVGIELMIKMMFTDNVYFKIYELLSPIINCNTLAIGLTF